MGIDLAAGGATAQQVESRQSAAGALLGYATGLGVGAAYGLLRPRLGRVSRPVAGVAPGLAALAGSDVPVAVAGVSDPRTWGRAAWAADLVPHLADGLLTAAAHEAFAAR